MLIGLNEWKNPHCSLDLSYVTPRGENKLCPRTHSSLLLHCGRNITSCFKLSTREDWNLEPSLRRTLSHLGCFCSGVLPHLQERRGARSLCEWWEGQREMGGVCGVCRCLGLMKVECRHIWGRCWHISPVMNLIGPKYKLGQAHICSGFSSQTPACNVTNGCLLSSFLRVHGILLLLKTPRQSQHSRPRP